MMIKKSKGFTSLEVINSRGKNKTKKPLTGFTIIELLVVVAIIAVLAAIVLINVTQYITKGRNAAIKANMSTILTNSAVFFDSPTLGNGTYTGFDANSGYTVPAAEIVNIGKTVTPGIIASKFCACATLYDTTFPTYCIDSSGYKKATATACATRCPTVTPTGVCVD